MSNIRITFLRDEKYQPVGCVAVSTNADNTVLSYGISVKSPQDSFDRKMARHLAIGRMVEVPRTINVHTNDGKLNMHDMTSHVMNDIIQHESQFPSRAVRAALLWVKLNRSIGHLLPSGCTLPTVSVGQYSDDTMMSLGLISILK